MNNFTSKPGREKLDTGEGYHRARMGSRCGWRHRSVDSVLREGYAIAADNDRYIHVERKVREAKRGMWAHAHSFDLKAHQHREPG